MAKDKSRKILLKYLKKGKNNAVTSAYLQRKTRFTDVAIRRMIRELIVKDGVLIGTNLKGKRRGFYIINSKEEALQEINTLINRATEILNRVNVIKQKIFSQGG